MPFTPRITVISVSRVKYALLYFLTIPGIVQERKIDVAVVPFGYTQERKKIVDYLMLSNQEHGLIYVRNPRETFDWEVYTKPLKKEAWIGICLFCLSIPILMMITVFDCKTFLFYINSIIIAVYNQANVKIFTALRIYHLIQGITHRKTRGL